MLLRRSPLLALLTSAALLLSGCASWDEPTSAGAGRELRESLPEAGELPDPRTLTGLSQVSELTEVEPVVEAPEPTLPVELTDSDGYEVVVEDVSRILPLDLYGTYSKALIGMGLGENIVGRTVSSTEPSLADLPVVTNGGHNLNVEAILQLQPSLLIVDHSIGPREAIDQIRDAGVTTVVMDPERGIDTFAEEIRLISQVVGVPEVGDQLAERSLTELAADREAIAELVPDPPLRMAFLYARGDGGVFFILGGEYGASDLIEGVGGVDVTREAGIGDMTPANAESLAQLNPDVFLMMSSGLESTGGIEGLLARPGIAQTTAGQNSRVVAIPDGDALAFGPQTGEVLVRTALALYDPAVR